MPPTLRTTAPMRPPRLRSTAALVPIALGLAACMPAPVTDEGRRVADLYALFMIAAIGVFVVVAGLIGWAIVRYRAGGRTDLPPQTHGNTRIEAVWWILPTLLVIYLGVTTTTVLSRVDAPAADDALVVEVEGFQWGWRFTYLESGVVVVGNANRPPTITLPVDRPISFVLTSPDVIHSFYVPQFLIKRDTIPGQTNVINLTITERGTYSGQCAEFCGLLHEEMDFSVDAVDDATFEAWLVEGGDE